jgi:hypothetical protein
MDHGQARPRPVEEQLRALLRGRLACECRNALQDPETLEVVPLDAAGACALALGLT